MSRQIKFRGKMFGADAWIVGDLVHSDDHTRAGILVADAETYDECEVDPKSVGQFTGFYDCDMREIFEGDILEIKHVERSSYFKVVFRFGAFYFENHLAAIPMHQATPRKGSIIGNIYDNLSLWKAVTSGNIKRKRI